ncbi:LOW QUALITY PROTEIN: hypothetical protein PHPALM_31201 [Phytophthora palmivora]|uniref:PiggyBac transposable element-derived protein domain-containing protein n=1 Tax=Phytophthora palmivora TaxID=4796 RepID=A0A2P4X361_9STRA|nr:LOW QUALITY PROTEIN: hypothetical protein PHPALM_31201 [Phytophthora palmivora]
MPKALAAASTQSGAFFHILQPQVWEDIAVEFTASIDESVEGQHTNQLLRELKHPRFKAKSRDTLREDALKTPRIKPRELCRDPLPEQNKTREPLENEGRKRHISWMFWVFHDARSVHDSIQKPTFQQNDDSNAATDRAWKLRPVNDALQDRFAASYTPPAIISFYDAKLPSRSAFNRMRVYIKDTLHKWGTIVLCCSTTAYRIRFELYCEKKRERRSNKINGSQVRPCRVARNLQQVSGPTAPSSGDLRFVVMRFVVMDQFYSSVSSPALSRSAQPAASIRSYCSTKWRLAVRRHAVRRHGSILFVSAFVDAASFSNASFALVEHTRCAHTEYGGSVQQDRIVRRDTSTGEQQGVACPRIVKDYQTYMGASACTTSYVFNDNRRSTKYKKYNKGLFLGLVDLAITNSYIIFNAARAASSLPKLGHVKFETSSYRTLRDEEWEALCINESFQATQSKEPNAGRFRRTNHLPLLNDERRPGNNNQGRNRRTRVCKVYTLLKATSNARGGDSSTYSLQNTSKKPMAWRIFLCDKKRHMVKGALQSCFDICHECWSNVTLEPAPQHR